MDERRLPPRHQSVQRIKRKARGELVFYRYGPSQIESESRFGCFGKLQRDAAAINNSADGIAPLDIEKTASGCGCTKTISYFGRSVTFDSRRQHEFVGMRRATDQTSEEQRRRWP